METKTEVDVQRLASPVLEAIARCIAGSEGMDPKISQAASKKPAGVGRQSGMIVRVNDGCTRCIQIAKQVRMLCVVDRTNVHRFACHLLPVVRDVANRRWDQLRTVLSVPRLNQKSLLHTINLPPSIDDVDLFTSPSHWPQVQCHGVWPSKNHAVRWWAK